MALVSSIGNADTPGTGTTLTELTFYNRTSSNASQMAMVDIISCGASPSALLCPIAALSTSCSVSASVPVTSTNAVNVVATGNGTRSGSREVTYTQP